MLIINNRENTTFFVMLHIRILSYNKSIIHFIRCFNTYHFNSSIFILAENIKSNTIKRHINNASDAFFQETILRISHLTLKDGVLYPLTIIYTSLSHTPQTACTFSACCIYIVCYKNIHNLKIILLKIPDNYQYPA